MANTIAEFVKSHGITIHSDSITANPRLIASNQTDAAFLANCTHWKVMLKKKRASRATLTVYFSRRGRDIISAPTAEEVLDSLAIDALSVDTDPHEITSELVLNLETAKKYIEVCKKRANGLRRVLGEGAYHTLLFETHRLLS